MMYNTEPEPEFAPTLKLDSNEPLRAVPRNYKVLFNNVLYMHGRPVKQEEEEEYLNP